VPDGEAGGVAVLDDHDYWVVFVVEVVVQGQAPLAHFVGMML
jgi:hypothetical protein